MAAGSTGLSKSTSDMAVINQDMGSAIVDLHGNRQARVQTHEPGFHLMWFAAAYPMLLGKHLAGETWAGELRHRLAWTMD